MDSLLSLLKDLGVDETLWVQLGCFLVSYLALTELVFKPYLRAHHEREKRTLGNEETATRIVEEAQELTGKYEKKARSLNADMKSVYDRNRSDAMKDYESMMKEARDAATSSLATTRQKIVAEIEAARKKLAAEIPQVSHAIASRLLGKDMSA